MRNLLKQTESRQEQTIIALLRHGKTVWNEAKRIQGHENSPLSEDGTKQVHQWGEFLSTVAIDRIVSSDLGRVQETVAIIQQHIENVPVKFDSALREQSWGEWEGKTYDELHEHQGEKLVQQVAAGWNFRPPKGESRLEVLQRALPVVADIIDHFPGERILLVSHEGIVKSLLYHLAGRAFMPNEKKMIQKRQLHLIYQEGKKLTLGPLNVFPNFKR
jgi:broad specificity phosphatase PhoE